MKYQKILGWVAAVGMLFTGCSESEDLLSSFHSDPNAVRITAEVGKASADGFTRSNPLGNAEEQAKFNNGDMISVKTDNQAAVTYMLVNNEWQPQEDGKFLKWESETMNFTAYYPATTYNGGTIEQPTEYDSEASLAAADFMSYSDSQSNTDGNKLNLTMNRQMARVVVEVVGFNDQYASDTEVKSVTINGKVKAFKKDKKFYALMVPCDADNNSQFLSLEVGEGNAEETLTGIPELKAGKSYTYQLTVGKNKVSVTGITVKDWNTGTILNGETKNIPYVAFTAAEPQTFKMVGYDNFFPDIEYSVGTGDWAKLEKNVEIDFGGNKGSLFLRGTNTYGTTYNGFYGNTQTEAMGKCSTIIFTNASVPVACTGDIRTLLDWKHYNTVATNQARFYGLFENCVALTSAPDLPATNLAEYCYFCMFKGCTNLKTAPSLPAETLAKRCYWSMFKGCTSLKTAPALSAKTLAEACYGHMFNSCTSLETAPALSAESLAYVCYTHMFYGCTSLKTAPALPSTTLAEYSYARMFANCTSLNEAPILPAEKLPEGCYNKMFEGCTNLSSVTMLAPSSQIPSNPFGVWLADAGTKDGISRTLKVKDKAAYDELGKILSYDSNKEKDCPVLPDNWKIGAQGTTVLDENGNKIE